MLLSEMGCAPVFVIVTERSTPVLVVKLYCGVSLNRNLNRGRSCHSRRNDKIRPIQAAIAEVMAPVETDHAGKLLSAILCSIIVPR